MGRCPKDEPTVKNLVCKESSSHSREKLEKLGHRRVNINTTSVTFTTISNQGDEGVVKDSVIDQHFFGSVLGQV